VPNGSQICAIENEAILLLPFVVVSGQSCWSPSSSFPFASVTFAIAKWAQIEAIWRSRLARSLQNYRFSRKERERESKGSAKQTLFIDEFYPKCKNIQTTFSLESNML
jgi:hypothetical protein